MEQKRIAIIGAGASGLLACKHALEKGFRPVVFEAGSDVGGVWASQTVASTKLQTPKSFYEFSDFPWPPTVTERFPPHRRVLEYVKSYAHHFNLLPHIRFNTKVVSIEYFKTTSSDGDVGDDSEEMLRTWTLWGGTGEAFSPTGRWNVAVQAAGNSFDAPMQVYEVDFVVLCIGRYSGLANLPDFPLGGGPEVFKGKVVHSMDYAAMDNGGAAAFTKNKRVVVVGSQKSAMDISAEISRQNGKDYPCTMLYKTAHWMFPEYLINFTFQSLNRFYELMVHKPDEGFLYWLLAILLSPLLLMYTKLLETYLKLIHPLRKYCMEPNHGFFEQLSSCTFFCVLPSKFYDNVKEKSLLLKKYSEGFSFCRDGLIVDGDPTPLPADIVIFATGYKSEEKLKNIFSSTYFQKCIVGAAPFYRECIHPRIPQLAIIGYIDSAAVLFATEMRSKWVAHFLGGGFKLPSVREMEEDGEMWIKCMRRYTGDANIKRECLTAFLQIYCNDKMCMEMGQSPRRKKWFLPELFAPYAPSDYADLKP